MTLKIHQLEEASEARWDAFVRAMPDATFFHFSAWRHVIAESFSHQTYYVYAEEAGEIVGILPLARMRTKLFGDALISTPFCVYGGPIAMSQAASDALEHYALELLRRIGADSLEFRQLHTPWPGWAVRPPLHYTFRKSFSGDAEIDMKAIPRKQRAMVRKGIQNGLRSVSDGNIDLLHKVYAESVRNLGTPVFSRHYFRMLAKYFPEQHDVVTVFDGDAPVASVLNFYFRDEVIPYYGGGTARARQVAANDFMYWEVMRRAGAERGCRLYDFGRSKSGTGAFDFKKNWGFTPQPLHYCYRLGEGAVLAEHNPSNPKYKLLIAAWRHLPLPVANLLGPPIVRGLG
ncbi:FemAB family PEP-CTERM system-associated protein [Roseomonas aerophila]|uniref:FemAB family PEP-CTERM system-associated protein n=1 Tax=Teichococcus aerophilus TaxID=1224513 RepID=A0ABR7RPK6_9PROT|nr:FemAB family XrtA/PEP-CTERM system-associated protein [Pseudoroseomonas aerophila]MBC9208298.1 FemAB family PEP-CTERM system-associated protein [Pseudoroseomonas aerophila]